MEMFQDDCEMLVAGSLLRKTDEVSLTPRGQGVREVDTDNVGARRLVTSGRA